MKRAISLFLCSAIIFTGFAGRPNARRVSANSFFELQQATISTHLYDRCTGQQIGTRIYTVQAIFVQSTQQITGRVSIEGEGIIAGTNQNYSIILNFPIYNVYGEKIGLIQSSVEPNIFPTQIPFSFSITEDPSNIKASIYQSITAGTCNGIFQDSEEFYFEQDVTNGTFQVPCSSVTQFSLSPNTVQPNDQVTVRWDVTNLVQHRIIRINGPGLSPTDRTTSTGSLTFNAPNSPGTYEYTLQVLDHNGNPVDCPPPSRQILTVSGERYFWLVKRMNPMAPITPIGSPFEYYSETFATPSPPGSNPTGSFIRVPESGTFQAPSFEDALVLSPFKERACQVLARMKCRDNRNYPPSGLISPDKAQAIAEYQNALESYRQALASFQNAAPKPGSGLVGPGNLSHARKTSEEISPYDN